MHKKGEKMTKEIKFIHCKKQCSYHDHCMCVFECGTFMLDYGTCNKENDLGWSVQAENDFIG